MPSLYDESWIYHAQAAPERALELDAGESAHLVRVLRLAEGTVCTVTDGRGSVVAACLERADAKRALLRCLDRLSSEPPPAHSLAQAVLKSRGLEDVVELCTQVPVRRIQPLWTKRVQVPRGRELDHQLERLRAKAVAGLQQSKQAWLCEIPEPMEWEAWLEKAVAEGGPVLVCHPTDAAATAPREGWIAVGPEGGFAPEEIEAATARGCRILSLGGSRLRAVAAGFWALGTRRA
jgi:16S rRNA (uracil1498-N3)-methyltransferase